MGLKEVECGKGHDGNEVVYKGVSVASSGVVKHSVLKCNVA